MERDGVGEREYVTSELMECRPTNKSGHYWKIVNVDTTACDQLVLLENLRCWCFSFSDSLLCASQHFSEYHHCILQDFLTIYFHNFSLLCCHVPLRKLVFLVALLQYGISLFI